ncbi:MAG: PQQ-binding-like beta-propeller repeat protein [Paludibacteraceae bacterium]|nr:PQQ-binding-like beta-propeller repeat protein [Paludibacteraceae bacterium]
MKLLSILLFSFALLTDTHISTSNPRPMEDLQRSIADINQNPNIEFVVVTGDLTENGDRASIEAIKAALDQLRVPYYAASGNHETTWSESGVMDFTRVFGDSRFAFSHNGMYFIGFNSGPVIRMADGHVAPQDIAWLKHNLDSVSKAGDAPIFVFTHYPLRNGDVDNWYDVTDVLRQHNVQCIMGGHYHRNLLFDCDGIADVLNRSNLRDKDGTNGYSIISITDSIRFYERVLSPIAHSGVPEQSVDCWGALSEASNIKRHWLSLPFGKKEYGASDESLRPDFSVNKQYKNVRRQWHKALKGGIYSTPVTDGQRLFIGDDIGCMYALELKSGKTLWTFDTGMRIVGSPAVSEGVVVFGSANYNIYGLDAKTGKELWHITTAQAVMGAATIHNGVAYIGGGDGRMFAIDIHTGKVKWSFDELKNYVLTRPLVYRDKLYFGCWDTHLYALNLDDGSLAWKWNNGKGNPKLSPASVWPVAADGKIFITAPDRYFTCLDAETGAVVWRTNQYKVRETVGLSEDSQTVYSKCMWDTIVAIHTTPHYSTLHHTTPVTQWVTHADFGYEHNPAMPLEKDGTLWVSTKNGLLLGMDAETGKVLFRHKIGNSILNTPLPLSGTECIFTSSEGTITYIKVKK